MQRGYPSRIPYDDIYSRYAPLMPDFVTELGAMLNGPEQALRRLLLTPLTADCYCLLRTTYYSLLPTEHLLSLIHHVRRTAYHVPLQALRPSQFVEAIAMAFGLQDTDFQLGQHKIFLRSGTRKYSWSIGSIAACLEEPHLCLCLPWCLHVPGKAQP